MDPNREYRIRIEIDDFPESPRSWDNLGTMVCWHSRYNLGDEQPGDEPSDWLKDHDDIIKLPLYLYDHSGLTMKTTPFSCPWDSGQVGWIYVTREKIAEQGLTEEQALECLEGEVKVYDQFLRGEVYFFVVESRPDQVFDYEGRVLDVEVEWDVEDSCGGFYGSNPFENGMSDHIDEELHGLLRETEVEY